jgi:hypothetical protein
MLAIVLGGIAAGTLIGAVGGFLVEYGIYADLAATEEDPYLLQPLILDAATWALVSAGAACVGAWQRIR